MMAFIEKNSRRIGAALWLSAAAPLFAGGPPAALFTSGEGGVHTFRIPAIAAAPNGDLVVLADARKRDAGDLWGGGPIGIVVRRSRDNGKTWTPRAYVHDFPDGVSASDPSLLVDSEAKTIFCLYNVWDNKRRPGVYQHYVQASRDNGATWGAPRDITADIHRKEWPEKAFVFISSGHGCRLKDGTLLHAMPWVGRNVSLFGSPDHGKTWRPYGNPASPGDESKVIELDDGSWMINSRDNTARARRVHVSRDRGMTWETRRETRLPDPRCNGAILRYPGGGGHPPALLFCNCNSSTEARKNLVLRYSTDEGKSWSGGVTIEPGDAAYSDIAVMKDGRIAVVYETDSYRKIVFRAVPPEELFRGCPGTPGR